ncbi:hypothetical protein [uncultured Imperialibacter sp.]|uniref:hypothetical protein n=1 Tax=uncultured Imperialibacter sp. TaxID=1672639 RepID=UPI0030D8BFE4
MCKSVTFIAKAVLIIAVLFLVDQGLSPVFQRYFFKAPYGDIHDINYVMSESNEKLIAMGSSKARHHFVSYLLQDSLNMSAFNAGMDGKGIYYHYVVLTGILERYKPEIIILDLSGKDLTVSSDFGFDALNQLLPYYGKVHSLDTLITMQGFSEVLKVQSRLFRYNSKLAQLIGSYTIPYKIDKGYNPLNGNWKGGLEELERIDYQIDSTKLTYLQRFIDVARSNNVELIVTISPVFRIQTSEQGVYEELTKILKSNRIPHLMLNQSPEFLAHPEWFADPAHLNGTGARVFTNKVAQFILHHQTK